MSGHFCDEHGVPFFKKGNMRGYAHKIDNTEQWCNEPKGASEESEPEHEGKPQHTPISKDEQIARHVWEKEAGLSVRMWKEHPETKPKFAWADAVIKHHYAEMLNILGIKSEDKE